MFMASGSLGEAIVDGARPAVLAYSGQDPYWADGVRRTLWSRPEVRSWAEEVLSVMRSRLASEPTLHPQLAAEGLALSGWLEGGTGWTTGQRAGRHLSLCGSLFAHVVAGAALAGDGLGVEAEGVRAVTGHSAGLLSAWVAARHGSSPTPEAAAEGVLAFAVISGETERNRYTVADTVLDEVIDGDVAATPMLAVSGPTEPRLRALLDSRAGSTVDIALQNCADRLVLGGAPRELARLADDLADVTGIVTEFVPTSCLYHHRLMEREATRAVERLHETGLTLDGDLGTPLLDPRDGTVHTGGDLTERIVFSMSARPVRWADTIADAIGTGEVLVDIGPSSITAAVCRRVLRGSGAYVIAADDPGGRRALEEPSAFPEPLDDWSVFRPTVDAGGPHRLGTRHTARAGRSAAVLAGMTPTTVDAEIVAAAANAGHVAELAGGGQVSPTVFAERMAELSDRLAPGHEVVFNALFLDPYLWNLQLGRDRLVQRARQSGAPINGVTVSAGIPEPDEAVALLDELVDLGIWLNAFKPGDVAGVRRVLAIAERTDHDIWLHLEGGLAGGHHSWEDLEDVLFATYADIRRHDNITLLVGGGIADPRRAAELVGGGWALRYGPRPMPVDGVLVGTVAMATAESTASAPVKAALVEASGSDAAVEVGEVAGGVTSGRSGLGADIHYLDNHASRVAAMLEEVAGDPEGVARRHDEIAEALAATAKPWFGDLTTMTWLEVVERYTELCALGRHGRYEDGRWLDVTHRSRFLDLLGRAEARCVDQDQGTFPSVFRGAGDLDDPGKAVELLRERYARAATGVLTPSDVAAVIDICDGPGKPVPFVVAIDGEIRRRYLADSLWQSHSDLWDADEVLVIPGPTAVAGIEVADEPVAELLDRFDAEVAALLETRGEADTAPATPAPNAVRSALELVTVRHGAATVRSPLALVADGQRWEVTVDGDRCVAEVRHGEETARVVGPTGPTGRVEMNVSWPSLPGVADDGEFRVAIDIRVDHGVVVGVLDDEALASEQAGVLSMLQDAAEQLAADRVGGASPLLTATPVPDGAMANLWSPVFGALREDGAADGLLRLVHARHRIRAVPGDDRTRSAGVIGHDHLPAGRRIHTEAYDAGTLVRDEFLVRHGGAGGRDPESDQDPRSAEGAGGPVADDLPDPFDDADGWISTPRHFLAHRRIGAPQHPEAFAAVSGDANPIHRSDLVARLAGLPRRIVHGMWTSATAQAFVVEELLDGSPDRLVEWDISFTDVVEPGALVDFVASRVAARDGHRRVEVRMEHGGAVVATAAAVVAPQRTAYVFPGQGIQERGMGLDALERSAAARGIWDRADRYCRSELGFSVLEVVRDNPEVLAVGDEVHRHPAGVLHLTQFTQVAMATLAAAQVEELRDSGVLLSDPVIAGHSVGEYNALASAGGALPLEAVLGIVWARGTAMHHLVPRAADGSSDYRLGVVRPHLAGLSDPDAHELVDSVADDTGELCQIVNHNLRGRQYAVAGTVGALEVLEARLGEGTTPGRPPFLLVPGIDVPFHSAALVDGVPEFRAHLDAVLPEEIDPADLVGRYVPNLHPEPFSLERVYVEDVRAACADRACGEILEDWDGHVARPGRLARELLVELLAWQFASPVRWIETTDVLLAPVEDGGLGIERVIEVGIGSSPTLTNLTRAAVAAESTDGVSVLHVEADRIEVYEESESNEPAMAPLPTVEGGVEETAEGDLDLDWDGDAPAPAGHGTEEAPPPPPSELTEPSPLTAAAVVPSTATQAGSPTEDRPVGVADALCALLAHLTHVGVEQLGDDSIDDLVDGASSRRNQVLMDLGKEFGLGSVDGANEAPRSVLAEQLAPLVRAHRHPGPVLAAAVPAGLSAALGPLGVGTSFVAGHVQGTWGLGEGWVGQIELELLLGTRDGASRRGGDLRSLPRTSDAAELVDAAVQAAAQRLGTTVERPQAPVAAATADAAELDALAERVGTAFARAADAAGAALGSADVIDAEDGGAAQAVSAEAERLRVLDLEHGADRAEAVAPVFTAGTVRCFDSPESWARADLDHLFHSASSGRLDAEELERLVGHLRLFTGADERFDASLGWYRGLAESAGTEAVASAMARIAEGPTPHQRRATGRLSGRTVLVSGASPDSIGEATAACLLQAGATVVMVSHSGGRPRRLAVRELVRRHAGPGARLFLLRANLASFTDIDRIVEWLDVQRDEDHSGRPDVVLPFAASPVSGDVPDTGARSEVELRVLLLGVERLVGRLAEAAGTAPGSSRLTAVLPMSPNHGTFGGDGSYGDAKAGLEVLESRRRSEFDRWGRHCRVVGAEIGWVRGTGLMAANDGLAAVVEQQLGVRTFSAAEMGSLIAELCAPEGVGGPTSVSANGSNGDGPGRVDLTGGLAEASANGALSRLLRSGLGSGTPAGSVPAGDAAQEVRELEALVTPSDATRRDDVHWPARPRRSADDMVVICGTAEIGPWGTGTTRALVERHGSLGAAGVVELALLCGLVEWDARGLRGEYVDVETGEPVAEAELVERYRGEVLDRCGIRRSAEPSYDQHVEVFLDRPVTVGVADRAGAEAFAEASAGAATVEGDGWAVTLPKGAPVRLRRTEQLPRGVTAAIPDGLSPTAFGVPAEMAGGMDRIAAWNLAVTAEAFRDAGTDPEEILGVVHPARVANTQGTGMGGLTSLRGMNSDHLLGISHSNDLLQEALGNVPAAHAMQSFIGGYGAMVHPVAACATAAVSLEVAADMVVLDKADVVVAGGFDDLTREGIIGFAEMAATADSAEMEAAGFEPSEMSRPGDRDRAGFVESQGGGTFLVCRGSVARGLGLPVRAVVGMARSHSDGVQTSIPAPGLGVLSISLGGEASPLTSALADLGLAVDDIAVVSKHDTSTRANDPNEAAIHERLCAELGRTAGNPLRVISQKALTGHAKGGAAAWQVAGVCDVFETGVVPGNPNLDSVDPSVQSGPWLVPDDRPLEMAAPPRAALLTSLGFGHVSAAVLLAHPSAFLAALDEDDLDEYLAAAGARRAATVKRRQWATHGGDPAYVRPGSRRLVGEDHEDRSRAEMATLTDASARLGPEGAYVSTNGTGERR